jgi:hypothetical protein
MVLSNGFVGAIADTDAQITLLGGEVATSRKARERLRAGLKRFARAVLQITD